MKYTYKELKGLSTGVQQNIINEAGQKVTSKDTIELLTLPDVESARIMSISMAYNGLQSTFQALDDYTNFLGAYIQEEEPDNEELKAEMDDIGGIINAELNDAYLKMVPYIMTDKEIQAVIDKGLTEEQKYEEVLGKLINKLTEGAEAEVHEIDGGKKVKVVSEKDLEKELDKAIEQTKDELTEEILSQIKGDKEANILDILNILFQSK